MEETDEHFLIINTTRDEAGVHWYEMTGFSHGEEFGHEDLTLDMLLEQMRVLGFVHTA